MWRRESMFEKLKRKTKRLIERYQHWNIKIRQKLIMYDIKLRPKLIRRFCADKECVFLIATPIHGNLGDQAIVYAERQLFTKLKKRFHIIEVSNPLYTNNRELIQSVIMERDIIVIDGGGSMGTLWLEEEYKMQDIVRRFPNNDIFIFPQTIFFSDDEKGNKELAQAVSVYSSHKKLTIFCRDELSFELMQNNFSSVKTFYTPDIVLSIKCPSSVVTRRKDVLICLRDDLECVQDKTLEHKVCDYLKDLNVNLKMTSTLTGGYIDKYSRKNELYKKWKEFSEARLVITDRLHGMIFCAITGTPCIALDNVSHKVKGGYFWLRELSYIVFLEEKDIPVELIQRMLEMDNEKRQYDGKNDFSELIMVIKKRIKHMK